MPALRNALAAAGLSIALLAVAAPVHAAGSDLPSGDTLVAASCTSSLAATLFLVDSTSGVSAAAGPGNTGYVCAYQAAWDNSTHTLYGTIWDTDAVLVKWDTVTGALVEIGPILDGVTPVGLASLVVDLNGNAYGLEYSTHDLYQIDLATGAATNLGNLAAVTDEAYGFAVDPTTGTPYLLQQDGALFTVDPSTVTATYVATWSLQNGALFTWGLAIDREGTAWVTQYPGTSNYTALWRTPLSSFGVAPVLSGDVVNSATGNDFSGWWVAIIDTSVTPALASTGVDAAPVAAGGLLLALAGVSLVAVRLGTRRRAAVSR